MTTEQEYQAYADILELAAKLITEEGTKTTQWIEVLGVAASVCRISAQGATEHTLETDPGFHVPAALFTALRLSLPEPQPTSLMEWMNPVRTTKEIADFFLVTAKDLRDGVVIL